MTVSLPPNRLDEMVGAYLRGEHIDPRKYALLQAADMVNLGREVVQSAIGREEVADEQFRKLLAGIGRDGG